MDSLEPKIDPEELTVGDLMVGGVVSIGPAETIGRARELMLGLGIHGLPVVDGLGVVIGFVTSSDLVEEWPQGEPVDTMMSKRVLSVDAGESVAAAARLMLDERIHHLLVTRVAAPAGVVSSFDMLAVLAGDARPSDFEAERRK